MTGRLRPWCLAGALLLLLSGGRLVDAADATSFEQHLSQVVESIVRASMPQSFEDRRHWNKHTSVLAGVKVRTDGLKVRISKREEQVRHGIWRRYDVTLIHPERTLQVRLHDVTPQGGGRWTFTVTADARVRVGARFEQWNLGIKLFNTSAEADASLRLRAACSLKVTVEKLADGPVLVLEPEVHRVWLALPNLDVRKFGELRGDAATDLFDGLEEIAEDLLQTQEDRVLRQTQRELARRADQLRIPLGELLASPWASLWLLP